MKTTGEKTKTLVILSILLVVGCVGMEPTTVTQYQYVPQKVCVQESSYYNADFSYPCEDRKSAKTAGLICEGMAGTAGILIEENRRIGPTSARALLASALSGRQGQGIKDFYDALYATLGKSAAQVYIEDIANMSVYISDRNITDRITYPNQKYRTCIAAFDYAVN